MCHNFSEALNSTEWIVHAMTQAWLTKANACHAHAQPNSQLSILTATIKRCELSDKPEMLCEVFSSIEMGVCPVTQAQLAGEVLVMHMLPELLPTEEVDVAEAAEGVGRS